MILLRLFCSNLVSALGLATTVVEPLPLRLAWFSPLDGPQARACVHFLRVACCVFAVEEAGHADSRNWEGQMRQAGMRVMRLQFPKFLLAKVATDWLCDLLQ